ncbi:MAG: glutamyl-tRNA reductase [Eubacterium sp.]
MFCISVNFKKTPLPLRQQFAFSEKEKKIFLSELMTENSIKGGVIVSTCNRSELYLTGDNIRRETVENLLSEFKQIDREIIKKYSLYYEGKKAVRHLFKVACGLDSMVLGEDEILHQVKESYLFSKENGFTDSELNIIFQSSFHCAKQSKSETELSKTPISIGTLTANTIENYMKDNLSDVQKENSETDVGQKGRVLVIGATGKIGSIVVKNLISKGIHVIATKRKKYSENELFFQNNSKVQWIDFECRYEYIKEVNVIVSATSSPHYTLTKQEFVNYKEKPPQGVALRRQDKEKPPQGAALRRQDREKDRNFLLIDLAVPYDIDKEIGEEKQIFLLDIDYFKTRSKENSNIKQGEVEKVKHMIEKYVNDVMKELYVLNFKVKMSGRDKGRPPQGIALRRQDKEKPPQGVALRRQDEEKPPQGKALRRQDEQWFDKMIYYLKDILDSEQFLQVLNKIYQEEMKGER